jgi:hypothetical protein
VFERVESLRTWAAVLALAASFAVMAKGASLPVDRAAGIAERLRVPRLLIGIVPWASPRPRPSSLSRA